MYKNIFILFITIISFSAKSQDYSQWSTGCYYDLNNARICGQTDLLLGEREVTFFIKHQKMIKSKKFR
jgi:hypothetical protein